MKFSATYRVGNGTSGNVGAEAISRIVTARTRFDGISVTVRNPLPSSGGTDPEPTAEARQFAPSLFRTRLERAITAEDYERIAERDERLQNAAAELTWTGSWHEADVAVDPIGGEEADTALLDGIRGDLERYRRMGHDLAVRQARYVPIDLELAVCALPHVKRAHVKAALLDAFSNRVLPGGARGFFHPDELTFGEGITLSAIVTAAQSVAGVECVRVTALHRLFEPPNRELENGVLPLRPWEIARLDNDPNVPERGRLEVRVEGGR
jgi:predicted phage baseplate assembly protein